MIETALCPVLVGREPELAILEDALLSTSSSQGQLVALAGEAGMGKTRLCQEVQRRASESRFAVLLGACQEADLSLPYLPFMEAIGNYLATIDPAPLREVLGSSASELGQLFPELRPPGAPLLSGADDPSQAKLRLYEAIMSLLRAIAGDRGLLLVLEDIHWADASARELLDYLARRIRTSRVMVLATYRLDEMHRQHPLLPLVQAWSRSGRGTLVDLVPLAPDGIDRMVSAIFDLENITTEFRDLLHRRTEGNPFVLEETLKDAIDRGDIYRTETGWDRRDLKDLSLPQSVAEAVVQRVGKLGRDAVEVLRAASVVGRSFPRDVLVGVSGHDGPAVDGILEDAVRQQLLEAESGAEERYRFRHALTWEAVYQDIIPPRRRALHGQVADHLRGDPTTPAVDLVHHLMAAGRAEEALPLCVRAGDEAAQQRAFQSAAELYERALEHAAEPSLRAELLLKLGGALFLDGQPARCQEYLQDGIVAAVAAGNPKAAARARLDLGRALWETGDPAGAQREYQVALDTFESDGPSAELAMAYMRLAGLRAFELEHSDAIRLARQAIDIAERAGAEPVRIWSLNFLGIAEANSGDIEVGLAHVEESYRLAAARDLVTIAVNAVYNLVETRAYQLHALGSGEFVDAVKDLGADSRAEYTEAFAAATVYLNLGRLEDAKRACERALLEARARGTSVFEVRARIRLAEIALQMGDTAQPETSFLSGGSLERQELSHQAVPAVQLALARNDIDRAVELVESLLLPQLPWLLERALTTDVMVEALLAGGKDAEAHTVARDVDARCPPHMRPYADRMLARIALHDGEADEARRRATKAATGLDAAGQAIEALHARLLVARAVQLGGHADEAHQLMQEVLEGAEAIGAGRIAILTRRAMGVDEPNGTTMATPAPSVPRTATERLVTVMFADLRGYTNASAGQTPERTVSQLRTLHRLASQAVTSRHGVVDKFAGDAVMATFNASGNRLDHATQALDAALTIVQRGAMNDLPVGVGLAVGPAVVGELTEGANLSVIGEATNLAARLQAAAAAGELLISAEAHRRTADFLAARNLVASPERLSLKGFAEPVDVYRVAVGALGTAPR